jgi:hypothetical protein
MSLHESANVNISYNHQGTHVTYNQASLLGPEASNSRGSDHHSACYRIKLLLHHTPTTEFSVQKTHAHRVFGGPTKRRVNTVGPSQREENPVKRACYPLGTVPTVPCPITD